MTWGREDTGTRGTATKRAVTKARRIIKTNRKTIDSDYSDEEDEDVEDDSNEDSK